MNKTKEKINSYFIHGFNEEQRNKIFDKKRIMYHYTSPEAFLAIIQNKTIRFTDIRYLNDKSEGIYFVKILLDFLDKNKNRYPVFAEVVNELLKENDFDKIRALEVVSIKYNETLGMPYVPTRKFVFCTCEEADSLNMWNYYVNNNSYQGYNIGFKVEELIKGFDVPNSKMLDAFSVYWGEVLYNKNEQFKVIEKYAQSIERAIEYGSSGGKEAEKMAYLIAQLKLRTYIDSNGIFYKHPKFKSEKEFRIVIEILNERIPRNEEEAKKYDGESNKRMYQEFCVKRGLIVPFLKVSFAEEAISRITTAPMIEFNIAQESVRELLKVLHYKGVSVHSSSIPIRF